MINWKTSRLYDLAARIETENQLYLDPPDRAKRVFTDSQSYWMGRAHDAAYDITPDDFAILDRLEPITDPDGKTYFQLPYDISGDDAKRAVVMSYILNGGTDYDAAASSSYQPNDFLETPYSSSEIQRIIDRQDKNSWTYSQDVSFVNNNGGSLVATPNGMLMGLGGNMLQSVYSQLGGTTYGDIFMLNIDYPLDPADKLQQVVESGNKWGEKGITTFNTGRDLDPLLHHEERHSQQWAQKGFLGMLWAAGTNMDGLEEDAGLRDGGYK
ncbi:hypothetical protein ACFWUP_09715 [Nocardia sp. NPDC058658]|uniref:hypothetical protein n=1 Tax=Nocardia sp. NPDC058658 TaxID=3346580 RepID=UPI0036619BB9